MKMLTTHVVISSLCVVIAMKPVVTALSGLIMEEHRALTITLECDQIARVTPNSDKSKLHVHDAEADSYRL